MDTPDPLTLSKKQYTAIIDKISSENSAVGIDAQYTHAIIINYLQKIDKRLTVLEELVKNST